MTAIAKLVLISILSVALAAVADEGSVISDIREAKTGNPIIELHPSANQEATQAFYLAVERNVFNGCLLYTSPSPRDKRQSRMPSSA